MKIWLLLGIIILAGFGLRASYAISGAENNMPDSVAYQELAINLADGEGFALPNWSQSAFNYSPGVPLILGGLFYLSGNSSETLGRVILALLASAAIPIAFLLARRLQGQWAGIAAATLVAFYPTLVTDSGMILTEGLAGTLLAGALLLAFVARKRTLLWFFTGTIFALGALVRPEFLLLALALTVFFSWQERSLRPLMIPLGLLLVIAPWSIYATEKTGSFVPVSSGGGQVLFTGAYLPSDGNPQNLKPRLLEEMPELRGEPLVLKKLPKEDLPADQLLRALALREAPEADPNQTLGRLGKERYQEALAEPLQLGAFMGQKFYQTWFRGRAALTSPLAGQIMHIAIIIGAFGGAFLLWRQRHKEAGAMTIILLLTALVALLLVASPRRVLAIWPVVASLSAVSLVFVSNWIALHKPLRKQKRISLPRRLKLIQSHNKGISNLRIKK